MANSYTVGSFTPCVDREAITAELVAQILDDSIFRCGSLRNDLVSPTLDPVSDFDKTLSAVGFGLEGSRCVTKVDDPTVRQAPSPTFRIRNRPRRLWQRQRSGAA